MSDDIVPDERRSFGDLVVCLKALVPIVGAMTDARPDITHLIRAHFAASFVATR
ncbi:hypothetical protein [Burkholderia sp. BCC1047]|uniref:hypothetical protein n=1 Tax=Burkholderia sp. BCC1047 TaxID=2676299 RepID=UPI00158EE978|nr:hypothetical protein [Burkholderia sp. BCC1047]